VGNANVHERNSGGVVESGCFRRHWRLSPSIESDPKWPGVLFNTTCLIGPKGILTRYRKANPWIPWEVHASPHDVPGYNEGFFPVADTEIGYYHLFDR